MKTVGDRVKSIMEYLNMNYNSFGKKLGYSDVVIGNIIKGRNKPSFDFINKLTQTFDWIDVAWLLTGHGEMRLTEEKKINEPTHIYKLRTDNNHSNQDIPLYNLEATAGLVELFQNHQDAKPIDYIKIPNLPKCDGAVFIAGDSMYPLLKSGDIVMYKELELDVNNIFWGEMYLISISIDQEEYVSVKWIQKSSKGGNYIKLVSENQHHQPKDIHFKKIRALALVKASIRINAMQ